MLIIAALITVSVLILALPVLIRLTSTAVRILVFGYLAFGIVGALAFSPNAQALTDNYAPVTYFAQLPRIEVIVTFGFIALCVAVGGATFNLISLRRSSADTAATRIKLSVPPSALWFTFGVALLQIVGVGPGTVLYSPKYLASTGALGLLKLSDALMPLAVIVAAAIAFDLDQARSRRNLAVLLLVFVEILLIGRASRSSALFFTYLYGGAWITGRLSRRGSAITGVLAVVVSLATISVPLLLRGGPRFGVIPALNYLASDPSRFFSGSAQPINNVLLGVPLSLYVGKALPPIETHAFWVGVNPLPSGFTDWASINPTLKLTRVEPYSGIGELLNYGWPYLIVFFAAVGFIFEFLTAVARSARGQLAIAVNAVVVGLAGVLMIRSTQYQLRTESRYVYYAIVLVLALTLLSRTRLFNSVEARIRVLPAIPTSEQTTASTQAALKKLNVPARSSAAGRDMRRVTRT